MHILVLALIGLLEARAATPVLYTGVPAEAEARARKEGRLKGEEIELHRLNELAPGLQPYVIGDPAPLRCAPGRLQNVRDGVENALANMDRSRDAIAALDLARLDLECLGEPVDPSLAAQLFYLRGFLAWRTGNSSQAEAAFYRALLFSPSVTWDAELGGPRPPPAFANAAARAQSFDAAWLRVVPDPAPGFSLRVDGKPLEPEGGRVTLKPGVHLVQVVADGLVAQPIMVPLDVGQEKALVIPVALSESLLARLDDPATQASLGPLLRAAWPDRPSYVTGPAGTWRYDPASGAWERR